MNPSDEDGECERCRSANLSPALLDLLARQSFAGSRRWSIARARGVPVVYENVWSVRINDQFRAVGERDGDTIE
ncbi:MAG TPA: hypothetical protein VHS31_19625 [Tepidisphaeraceae bacterium]|nr:hypothetical protein [Tepidisphaeraceae bacterium]